ncbi:collagen-like triple helix repeat-containing protein, partial [Bacillus tropicus]|uniref:collagen-like triple helix repeat-containing protein n=1 Tax=Bacillus tropicus TaxID=2026188 RepID=UPI000B75218F
PGPQGIQGEPGVTGPTGDPGPTGPTGPNLGNDYASFSGEDLTNVPSGHLLTAFTLNENLIGGTAITFSQPSSILLSPNQIYLVNFGGNITQNSATNSTNSIGITLDDLQVGIINIRQTIQDITQNVTFSTIIQTGANVQTLQLRVAVGGGNSANFDHGFITITRLA